MSTDRGACTTLAIQERLRQELSSSGRRPSLSIIFTLYGSSSFHVQNTRLRCVSALPGAKLRTITPTEPAARSLSTSSQVGTGSPACSKSFHAHARSFRATLQLTRTCGSVRSMMSAQVDLIGNDCQRLKLCDEALAGFEDRSINIQRQIQRRHSLSIEPATMKRCTFA